MACSIIITSVIGIPTGGGLTSTIHVTGTLSGDCEPVSSPFTPIKYDVVVVVNCGGGPISATTLSSGGSWAIDVQAICACSKDITVTAECASNPACKDTFTGVLQCQQGVCPTGSIAVSPGDCNADGTRNVTLTATITGGPTPPIAGNWIFQSGVFGPGVNISSYPTTLPSQVHAYAPPGPGPGDPAEINWLIPSNCAPLQAAIPNLQSCSIVCPTNVQVQVTASTPSDCTSNNTRLVTFSALVSGTTPQYFNWDFPGGNPSHVDGLGSPPSQTVEYAAPSNPTASCTVTILNGACAYTGMKTITIPACGGNGGNGGNGGFDFCAGLLIAAITLLVLGAASIIVGVCFNVPPLVIAGGIAAVIGLLLFILWVVLCARFTSCSVMQTMHCILFALIAVVAPIIALLAFVLTGFSVCLLTVLGAWGGWGTIYAWLGVVMGQVGCAKIC